MISRRQKMINFVIALVGTLLFCVILTITVIRTNGLKFNSHTGSFDRTALVAVKNKIDNVTVTLNGTVEGNSTPITIDNLSGGRYHLTLSKEGFHPFEQYFQLSPGDAGVVKQAVLIANTPAITELTDQTYKAIDPFDVGLFFQDGELLDYNNLVSRFSAQITQAHRFNEAYLYQEGRDLHLFFPDNNQDFVVFTGDNSDPVKLNLSPSNWSLTVFGSNTTAKRIQLIVPATE